MQAFKRIKLGQALTFQRGFDITKAEQTHGSIPIVSSSGVSSYHNVAKVNSPGVIIGRKGTLGTVHAVNTPFWPHDTTLWVKDFKGNDPRFLYYFLKTLHLENFDTGSSNPTLNRNHLHKIEVVFPVDVDVQRKIAGILSAYDDLIENNRRRIAILERMAEELYREWFVRMRFPGYQNTKFVKGVPEGWEQRKLGEVVTLNYGKALKTEDRVTGPYPVYGSGGIVGSHHKPLVDRPGLIVGRKGNVGSVYYSDRGFFPIDTVYYVESKLADSYLYHLLRSMNFINNDAAVPGLNRNQAYSNLLLLPQQKNVTAFEEIIGKLTAKVRKHRDSISILTSLRESLLNRLVSGKLHVAALDIRTWENDRSFASEKELAHA